MDSENIAYIITGIVLLPFIPPLWPIAVIGIIYGIHLCCCP